MCVIHAIQLVFYADYMLNFFPQQLNLLEYAGKTFSLLCVLEPLDFAPAYLFYFLFPTQSSITDEMSRKILHVH